MHSSAPRLLFFTLLHVLGFKPAFLAYNLHFIPVSHSWAGGSDICNRNSFCKGQPVKHYLQEQPGTWKLSFKPKVECIRSVLKTPAIYGTPTEWDAIHWLLWRLTQNPQSDSKRHGQLSSPLYQWRNWGAEGTAVMGPLPLATQPRALLARAMLLVRGGFLKVRKPHSWFLLLPTFAFIIILFISGLMYGNLMHKIIIWPS